jgi:ketosteroid isomerase-like protein
MSGMRGKTEWTDCNGTEYGHPVPTMCRADGQSARRRWRDRLKRPGASLLAIVFSLSACTGMRPPQDAPPESASLPSATDSGAIRTELLAIADAWDKAIVAKDRAGIEKNMAQDFMQIPASGSVVTRTQFIEGVMSPDLRIEPYRVEDLDVRVFGDAALLTGHIDMRGTSEGQSFRQHFRFTDVYARRQGRWQIVAMQITPMQAARPDTARTAPSR